MRKNKFSVRFLAVAEGDLSDIFEYVFAENPVAAKALLADFEKSCEHLSAHPYLGRVPSESELMKLGYRFLVVKNYLVFYTIEINCILIHRILHGARDYIGILRQ